MPIRISMITLLCALLIPVLLFGQAGTEGAFFGTVADASGAAVPGAEVTVANLANGLKKMATTDAEGNFNILALPIGTYSVSVTAKGFKKWELAGANLTVGDRNRLSPVLQVGDVSETVSVEATAELIQTEKAALQTVVQMQQIRELPLATRNPLALVATVPGMRYEYTQSGGERGTYVQGLGLRNTRTEFTLDGLNANAPMDEGGTAMPNVDTVAEFKVETGTFSAESGRKPIQVKVVSKSGTNELHGSLWEFVQNDTFNARPTFSAIPPRVRRNQFGGAAGGPAIKNKLFFFGSFEGTVIHNERVYNSLGVSPAMKAGDFSAMSKTIKDPYSGGAPFAGNRIPASQISGASKYFLPLFVEPNSPDGYFKTNAGYYNDTWEGAGRVDYQITDAQRVYGRYVQIRQPQLNLTWNPTINGIRETTQHNVGVNYTWTMSPSTLLSASAGRMSTRDAHSSPVVGKQNDDELAGIQGFPTAGREPWIGPPNMGLSSGYPWMSLHDIGWGTPGALWGHVYNAKASINHIRGTHTLSAGGEYGDWQTLASHGGNAVRGFFGFWNLYTNDGFGDYLLGLPSYSERNSPLTKFGNNRAPYVGLYVQDSWRVRPNLTVEPGLRYERWLGRTNLNNAASTWDPAKQKVVAAVQSDGSINMNAFSTTPFLAASSKDVWITAREAGYPDNLFLASGNFGPRLSAVYRPFANRNIVIRAGYGLYFNSYLGNRAGSSVNLPHWSGEATSYSGTQLQRWETIWSSDPRAFGLYTIYAPAYDIKPMRTHEWNISVQTALPFETALTLSYVGTRVPNEMGLHNYNVAPVGFHSNLQADRPFPRFANINRYENGGSNWYNALQTKIERRFADGLAFTFAHSFSRSMGEGFGVGDGEFAEVLLGSPAWYNRGRTPFDFRQIEFATLVWEIPVGRGRKFHGSWNRAADALLGGWQLAVTQQAQSGGPLSIWGGVSNLGNGYGTRANLIGDPNLSDPTPRKWFNTAAFASPANYTFGNSGIGLLEGPGLLRFNTSLSKSFRVTEQRYFQFRWETFNTTNRVNYNNPDTTVTSGSFGRISSSGDARYMQLGLKFLF